MVKYVRQTTFSTKSFSNTLELKDYNKIAQNAKRSLKRKKFLGIREVVKTLPSTLWKAIIPGTARETCSCAHA